MDERLKRQLDFTLEIDKEKNIFRQTHLSGHGRRENDAEHAWHMAIMTMLLSEYANEPIDVLHTIGMLLIHDLVEIDAGEAWVLGNAMRTLKRKDFPTLRRKLGIVFQDFQLLTDRTVHENLKFVLKATGWKNRTEIERRIEEVLQQVGMENKGYKMPNELSGGEQQRIVIARAILNKPEIILADEPTGNLDVETGRRIVELLQDICRQGSAILMTTHNLNLLSEYSGKVYKCEHHRLTETTNS